MGETSKLYIIAMIAGVRHCAVHANMKPHESVEKMLDILEQQLVNCEMPYAFTAAYSLVHSTNGVGLRCSDPDFDALCDGDAAVTARYLTPAARLDPTKTVADYFGTRITKNTISIVLEWTAESWAIFEKQHELSLFEFARFFAKYPNTVVVESRASTRVQRKTADQAAATTEPATLVATAVSSPWSSMASWLSGATRSWLTTSTTSETPGLTVDSKKLS